MTRWTCQCGEAQYFGSGMEPMPCEGCDECGSAFGLEGNWRRRIPHVTSKHTHNGKPLCGRCYQVIDDPLANALEETFG